MSALTQIDSEPQGTPRHPEVDVAFDPADQARRVIQNVSGVFLGKDEVVTRAVLALISGGHILIEDVPGLGKTLLAKALAKSLSAEFTRVQFTADLLPSDVTGVTVFQQDTNAFSFRKGPVFTNVLLGDEINRATPRTQSSLLEAMEEEQVSVDGVKHALPSPFFVVATQHPVELEGTYPLPFAQMDRFILKLSVGYLGKEAELQMLRSRRTEDPIEQVKPVLSCAALVRIQSVVREVAIAEPLLRYLVDIIHATRAEPSLEFGGSPRASLDLQRFSQATALLAGRDYVLPDDIKQSARLILPHRFIYRKGTRIVSGAGAETMGRLLDKIPVPL